MRGRGFGVAEGPGGGTYLPRGAAGGGQRRRPLAPRRRLRRARGRPRPSGVASAASPRGHRAPAAAAAAAHGLGERSRGRLKAGAGPRGRRRGARGRSRGEGGSGAGRGRSPRGGREEGERMGKMGEGGIWERLAVFSALSPFSLGVQGVVSIRGGSPEAATASRAATGWDQPFWGVSLKASPKWGSQEGDTFTDHSCETPSHSRVPWGGFGNSGCPAPCPGLVTRSG